MNQTEPDKEITQLERDDLPEQMKMKIEEFVYDIRLVWYLSTSSIPMQYGSGRLGHSFLIFPPPFHFR